MSGDIRSPNGMLVLPPNKPMDDKIEFSKSPIVYNHLFFLDFNEIGQCLLGSSNITGTFWEGSLLYFKNIKDAEYFNYAGYYIYSTTSDAKFVNNDTIAVAEDAGTLTILKISDENTPIHPLIYYRHSQRIPQIAVWPNTNQLISCSGRIVSIYNVDNEENRPLKRLDNIHLDNINSVDVIRDNKNVFVSASSDRKACIWDCRNKVPASVLYSNEFSSLTSIATNPLDSNYFIIGSQAGDIYLVDKRETNHFVKTMHCYDGSVRRISFNNNTSKQFAVCGDDKQVIVIKGNNWSEKGQTVRIPEQNYIRDVKWYQEDRKSVV